MGNSLFIFFILFTNLYFPISPILVTGIDLCIAIWLYKDIQLNPYGYLILGSFLLLFFSIISFIFADNPENQVLFKYIRSFISTLTLIIIGQKITLAPTSFLRLISAVFLSHIIAIFLQILHPQLGPAMAPYFNFSRELAFLRTIQLRKLGLCGGFDAASMVLIAALIFFYINFMFRKNILFLALSIVSALMTLYVSRLGLIFAGGVLIILALLSLKRKGIVRITGIILAIATIFFSYIIILPILAATNGIHTDITFSTNSDVSYYTQDYRSTNGSVDGLTHYHLYMYKELSFFQIIFGAGNSSKSDIGYIQILFQTGLIGLIIVMCMHIWTIFKIKKTYSNDSNMRVLHLFCIAYMFVLFLFNYKILLLYSRGFYDFYILCFIYSTYPKTNKQEEMIE